MANFSQVDYSRSVPATSTKILPVNLRRIHCTIQNIDPANNIWIRFGCDATTTSGVKLSAGASYEISLINPWPGEVYAIADVASIALIQEVSG